MIKMFTNIFQESCVRCQHWYSVYSERIKS